MDEMDSLLDSLLEQRKGTSVSYVDDRYANVLKLEKVPSKGEGVTALKTLPVTEPICSLKYPTMMAMDPEFLPTTCYHCLIITSNPLPLPGYGHTSMDLKTCNGCHIARFCGRDCQVKSWHAYHKYECKVFKKVQNNLPSSMMRAVLRMVLLKDRGLVSDEEWDRVIGLDSHEQILAGRGRSNLTDMAETIKHLATSGMSVTMIQRLIFIMKSNANELPTPIYGGIGVMLDPLIGKLNHSCEPNISIHRPQHTMASGWMDSTNLSEDERKTFIQIIPLREIKEGEELLNCYIVPTVAVEARRAKLMEDYFFHCECGKCQSDVKAAAQLIESNPDLSAQFGQWAQKTIRSVPQQVKKQGGNSLSKAMAAMDHSERFLEHPTLYTTGDYPQIAMRLTLLGLQSQAFDIALINMLWVYFLVNPQRFVGGHTPTEIYTIFLLLDILDGILRISMPSGIETVDAEKWSKNLTTRGLTLDGLLYWRDRICSDLERRLAGSAAKDLLSLVEKRKGKRRASPPQGKDKAQEQSATDVEAEMRSALRLKESVWKLALHETGC